MFERPPLLFADRSASSCTRHLVTDTHSSSLTQPSRHCVDFFNFKHTRAISSCSARSMSLQRLRCLSTDGITQCRRGAVVKSTPVAALRGFAGPRSSCAIAPVPCASRHSNFGRPKTDPTRCDYKLGGQPLGGIRFGGCRCFRCSQPLPAAVDLHPAGNCSAKTRRRKIHKFSWPNGHVD